MGEAAEKTSPLATANLKAPDSSGAQIHQFPVAKTSGNQGGSVDSSATPSNGSAVVVAENPEKKKHEPSGNLVYDVTSFVVENDYEGGIEALRSFYNQKSDYPKFRPRIKRYVDHSIDLIHAIKNKRTFPGKDNLSKSKQQELDKRVKDHFDELSFVLKRIEQIKIELKQEDVRSTIWVIRSINLAVLVLLVVALVSEFAGGLLKTLYLVLDDSVGQFSAWLFSFFK